MKSKAVFLDRDGTIARDVHYCSRPEDLELLPTVPEAIRMLNGSGFKVVVVTNQSGIARGYFTEDTLALIHEKMKADLARYGAHVDAIYYCPHHPDDHCLCRKPGTLLFRRAAEEMDIDLAQSFVVGDLPIDIQAGQALGCKTFLVTTGPESADAATATADHVVDTLAEVWEWVDSYPAARY